MKTLTEKREDFLLDMLEYYTFDTSRRCVLKSKCRYSPVHPNTEGCAIGRKIPRELAIELDIYSEPVIHDSCFYKLPPEIQELGKEFLYNVQNLHDMSSSWDEQGLSLGGSSKLNRIVKMYSLQTEKFEKYYDNSYRILNNHLFV